MIAKQLLGIQFHFSSDQALFIANRRMKSNVDSEFNRIVIDTEIFDDRPDDRSPDRSDSGKIVPQARGALKSILPTVQGTTRTTTFTTKITSKVPQNKLAEPLPNYFRENHQWDIRTRFKNSDFSCAEDYREQQIRLSTLVLS